MKSLILYLVIALPLTTSAATLEIDNIRSTAGFIAVNIFNEQEQGAFPEHGDQALQTYYVPIISKGSQKIELKALPPGRYAVTVMHDEDGDGLLKKGPLGIPREGFGFSKNPRVYFGAPTFDKVVTKIQDDTLVKIDMKYLL
jgi:uncharacterized protein (DUF2141 family)